MTTEDYSHSQDICNSDGVYFSTTKTTCTLSAVLYEWNDWEPKKATTARALLKIIERQRKYWPAAAPRMFVGHSAWLADTRVSRHKSLWSQLNSVVELRVDSKFIKESIIESAEGIKHFVFFECCAMQPDDIAELLRSGWEAQLIFSELNVAESAAHTMLHADWGRKSQEIGVIAELACELDLLAFMPVGWFDDRQSGGALVGKIGSLRHMYQELHDE